MGQGGVDCRSARHKPRAPFQPKRVHGDDWPFAAHVARSRAEALVAAAEEARYDNEQRLELKRRFAPTKERRVIAMALYGDDPSTSRAASRTRN